MDQFEEYFILQTLDHIFVEIELLKGEEWAQKCRHYGDIWFAYLEVPEIGAVRNFLRDGLRFI